jgi:ribosomal protein S18 acetylase RimI-like enzyme
VNFTDESVQRLRPEDVPECARLMTSSEPWITLGIPFEIARAVLADPAREGYAVRDDRGVAGFMVLDMRGLVSGYIQILCVRSDCRGQGLGSLLIRWAERRIARDSPNVFICVSSFNADARRLYERLGFEPVGVLRNLIVSGHDEILLRKTHATWADFRSRHRMNREDPVLHSRKP